MKRSLLAAALITSVPALVVNLMVNGSFDIGYTGSSLDNTGPLASPSTSALDDAYLIATGAAEIPPFWHYLADYTPGAGYNWIDNGATESAGSNTIAERHAIKAPATGNDSPKAFAARLCGSASPESLSALLQATLIADDGIPVMTSSALTFDRATFWTGRSESLGDAYPALTLRTVSLIFAASNREVGGANLSLTTTSPVPEPAIWALLISGFTIVGAAARRRRIIAPRTVMAGNIIPASSI